MYSQATEQQLDSLLHVCERQNPNSLTAIPNSRSLVNMVSETSVRSGESSLLSQRFDVLLGKKIRLSW